MLLLALLFSAFCGSEGEAPAKADTPTWGGVIATCILGILFIGMVVLPLCLMKAPDDDLYELNKPILSANSPVID